MHLRPLRGTDAAAARTLLYAALGGTPYLEAQVAALETALSGSSDEARGIGAWVGEALAGLVLHGRVAGTVSAGKVHVVAVAPPFRGSGVGARLCDAAAEALRAGGATLAVTELPDDAALDAGRALLARCGFREESRVPDLYRDGVALVVLRRELDG